MNSSNNLKKLLTSCWASTLVLTLSGMDLPAKIPLYIVNDLDHDIMIDVMIYYNPTSKKPRILINEQGKVPLATLKKSQNRPSAEVLSGSLRDMKVQPSSRASERKIGSHTYENVPAEKITPVEASDDRAKGTDNEHIYENVPAITSMTALAKNPLPPKKNYYQVSLARGALPYHIVFYDAISQQPIRQHTINENDYKEFVKNSTVGAAGIVIFTAPVISRLSDEGIQEVLKHNATVQ